MSIAPLAGIGFALFLVWRERSLNRPTGESEREVEWFEVRLASELEELDWYIAHRKGGDM